MRAEEANFERWYGGKRGCEGTRHGKDVNFRMHKAVCKRTSKTLVGRRDFAELGGLSVVNDGTDEKAARYPPLSSDIHYKHATPDFLATISTRTVVQNEHKRWNAAETRVEVYFKLWSGWRNTNTPKQNIPDFLAHASCS